MADLYKEIRGAPVEFGPTAGLNVIESIKRAYHELAGDPRNPPATVARAGAAQAPQQPAPGGEQAAADAPQEAPPLNPQDIPDEEIAKAHDPRDRYAAFLVKYNGRLPPTVRQHFSLLDELTSKVR